MGSQKRLRQSDLPKAPSRAAVSAQNPSLGWRKERVHGGMELMSPRSERFQNFYTGRASGLNMHEVVEAEFLELYPHARDHARGPFQRPEDGASPGEDGCLLPFLCSV